MPIEKIECSQKQSRLFYDTLTKELNPKNKLYKLRSLINWSSLEEEISKLVNISEIGRARKSIRVLLGVSMLQAMYNFSDSLTSEELEENVYWQYFCGYEYVDNELSISESSIRRFRNILGDVGYNIILKELARIGLKTGVYKKKIWTRRLLIQLYRLRTSSIHMTRIYLRRHDLSL